MNPPQVYMCSPKFKNKIKFKKKDFKNKQTNKINKK